jgi:mannan endo-1,4-beta-mannosidase
MNTIRTAYRSVNVSLAILLSGMLIICQALPVRAIALSEAKTPPIQTASTASGGFHVSGRYLLDANGKRFIMRGISHPYTWFPSQTSSFKNIKSKGANTVRVVLSSGAPWTKNSASNVTNVINLCKANKLICILEVHNTTGYGEQSGAASLAQAVAYWKGIKSVLIGQEAYVLINIGNEPYGNNNVTNWVNDTKNAIIEMRNAGFQHTLVVDAPNWGQDSQFVMRDNAASVLASDPLGNTIFSIHMFGVFNTAQKVDDYLSAFVNANLPLIVGEFGAEHTDGDPDEDAIMEKAVAYEIGYLGWSWSGNSAPVTYLDMVTNFDPNKETRWGNRIFRGANGICLTSVEASAYGGNRVPIVCSITRADPNPNGAVSLHFSVQFSEAVTGVGKADFSLTTNNVSGATITSVTGSGATYTVTVGTGTGNGTIRLNVQDDDSVKDATTLALGGAGTGNGYFGLGETYTATQGARITIGTQYLGSYTVPSHPSTKISKSNTVDGPVRVTSARGGNLFASERVIASTSFNEIMGYPTSQLTTEYWFPWYDNIDMATWILVGNPTASTAAVDIYIGGEKQVSTAVSAGGRITPRFPLKTGPVKVVSTNGVKIFTSERTVYGPNNAFNEVMGNPANQFTTEYWFPWYDNVTMATWILVGNPSTTSSASVDIYIGGVKRNSYVIPKGGNVTPRFNITPTGPVRVVSTNGVPIFTSERTIAGDSFNEVMGYPGNQLTTEYWYPLYDNSAMSAWILVGNPSTSSVAMVDIYIGGVKRNSYVIPKGGNVTPRFNITPTGPVQVVSTNGVKIFTSERVLYGTSFNEVMGYPGNKLTTEYWFPWYDSTSMSTDIVVGAP